MRGRSDPETKSILGHEQQAVSPVGSALRSKSQERAIATSLVITGEGASAPK